MLHDDYELQICKKDQPPLTAICGVLCDMPRIPIFPYSLNILNEKRYPPTASRDMMSSAATEKITELVIADFKALINNVKWKSISQEHIELFKGYNLKDHLSEEQMSIVNIRGKEFDALQSDCIKQENEETTIRKKTGHVDDDTYYHFEDIDTTKKHLIKFFKLNPDATVILTTTGEKMQDMQTAIKVFDMKSVREYLKEYNGTDGRDDTVKVYVDGESRRTNITKIGADVTRIPKGITVKQCLEIVRRNGEKFAFVSDTAVSKKSGAVSLADRILQRESMLSTSKGVISSNKIMSIKSKVCVLAAKEMAEFDTYIRDFTIYGKIPCASEIAMNAKGWNITRVTNGAMESRIADEIFNDIKVHLDIKNWSMKGIESLKSIKNMVLRRFVAENAVGIWKQGNEKNAKAFAMMDSETSKMNTVGAIISKVFSDEKYESLRAFVIASNAVRGMDQNKRIKCILGGVFPQCRHIHRREDSNYFKGFCLYFRRHHRCDAVRRQH